MAERQRMTARQIRDSLKPFRDFAPAILDASQIAEEAEANEKVLAEQEKRKTELATAIRVLEKDHPRIEKEHTDAQHALDEANNKVTAAKRELAEIEGPMEKTRSEGQAKIAEQLRFEERRVKAEIDKLQALIDAKKKELADAEAAWMDWKKARGF